MDLKMTNTTTKATKREKQDLIVQGILAHPELNEKFGGKLKLDLASAIEQVVVDTYAALVLDDKKVTVGDIGQFEPRGRNARSGFNPILLKQLKEQGVSEDEAKEQAKIQIAASKAVGFKPSKAFKDELNGK